MTEAEVMKMVLREVTAIKKRDGELPKTPYLWAEVRTRLTTLKPWQGLNVKEPIGKALRLLVEAAAQQVGDRTAQIEEPPSPQHMPPLEAAQALGTKKHKHLRTKGTTHARQLRPAS